MHRIKPIKQIATAKVRAFLSIKTMNDKGGQYHAKVHIAKPYGGVKS